MNQNEKKDLPQRSNNREKTINQITSESAHDLFVLCKKNKFYFKIYYAKYS